MMTMVQFIEKYLAKNPDARLWVISYLSYVHAIDDIIDKHPKINEPFILDTFGLAPKLFGNIFYLENFNRLYPLVKMAHDCYRDSVIMEQSNEKWKQHYSDFLRQNAVNLILECVEILEGKNIRDAAAMILWEIAYKTHHTEEGVRC